MLKASRLDTASGPGPRTASATRPGAGDPAMPPERTIRENFPVALRILPARHRAALGAVYRYARLIDDIGDEAQPADRGRLFDLVDRDIDRIFAGAAPELPALRAIGPGRREHGVPEAPLRKLVQANRQDQEIHRYATWDQLVEYCALSADPVGHLVLHVVRRRDPRTDRAVRPRLHRAAGHRALPGRRRGLRRRPGLPARRRPAAASACTDADLGGRDHARPGCAAWSPRRSTAPPRCWTTARPLVGRLDGWARLAVAGYVAGGRAALDGAARAARYDVLAGPPARPSRGPDRSAQALLILGRDVPGDARELDRAAAYAAVRAGQPRTEARNFAYGIRLLPRTKRQAAVARSMRSPGVSTTSATATETARRAAAPAGRRPRRRCTAGRPARTRCWSRSPTPRAASRSRSAPSTSWSTAARPTSAAPTTPTSDELVVYCRCVAGSIGRLCLGVFGAEPGATPRTAAATPTRSASRSSSPTSCATSREDLGNGRVYLPAGELVRFGCTLQLDERRPLRRRRRRPRRAGPRPGGARQDLVRRGPAAAAAARPAQRGLLAAMAGIYRRLLAAHRRAAAERAERPDVAAGLGEGVSSRPARWPG